LSVFNFLVDKLPTFCCGYICEVTCKRSATINKSGLNVASGVMMYSCSWKYILCLQGDERPEDSEVGYNYTIYNIYFLRNLFALASLLDHLWYCYVLFYHLPFLLSDGPCNVVIYMCYSSLLLVTITKVQSLDLGRRFGNLGRPENAKPLCGWQLGTIVGRRIVCKKGTASPGALPSLWPRGRNGPTHSHFLRLRKAVLVCCFTTS